MTRIVVDSTCDMEQSLMDSLGIISVPLRVHFGDQQFRDKIDLDDEKFFSMLETATQLPTTSQPSPGDFLEAYKSIPDDEPVISIHIASQLSGTLGSAQLAASQLEGREIRVMDSGTVTWGAGLMVIAAAEAIRDGKSAAEVEQILLEMRPRVRLLAILDTLKYVIMGGRVSRAQGMIGGLLRVKAMMLIREGLIEREPPARTWSQAQERVIADIQAHGGPERLAVIHARAPEAAAAMQGILEREFPGVEIHSGAIGPVVGTHAGPGAIGVAYVAGGPA